MVHPSLRCLRFEVAPFRLVISGVRDAGLLRPPIGSRAAAYVAVFVSPSRRQVCGAWLLDGAAHWRHATSLIQVSEIEATLLLNGSVSISRLNGLTRGHQATGDAALVIAAGFRGPSKTAARQPRSPLPAHGRMLRCSRGGVELTYESLRTSSF